MFLKFKIYWENFKYRKEGGTLIAYVNYDHSGKWITDWYFINRYHYCLLIGEGHTPNEAIKMWKAYSKDYDKAKILK